MIGYLDNSNILKGKEIFDKYNGDYYAMSLDGTIEEYKSLNISEEIEKDWIKQRENDLLKKLEDGKDIYINFSKLCDIILAENNFESYSKMISSILSNYKELNDFQMLLIAERIIEIRERYVNYKNIILIRLEEKKYLENLNKINKSLILSDKFSNLILKSKILNIQNEKLKIDKDEIKDRANKVKVYVDNVIVDESKTKNYKVIVDGKECIIILNSENEERIELFKKKIKNQNDKRFPGELKPIAVGTEIAAFKVLSGCTGINVGKSLREIQPKSPRKAATLVGVGKVINKSGKTINNQIRLKKHSITR